MRPLAVLLLLFALSACERHYSSRHGSTSAEIYGSREFPYAEACEQDTPEAVLQVTFTHPASPDPIEVEARLVRSAEYKTNPDNGGATVNGVKVSLSMREKRDGEMVFDEQATTLIPFFEDREGTAGAYAFKARWIKRPAQPPVSRRTI